MGEIAIIKLSIGGRMAVAHSVEAVLIHDAVAGTGVVDGGSVHEVLLYDDLLGRGWNGRM